MIAAAAASYNPRMRSANLVLAMFLAACATVPPPAPPPAGHGQVSATLLVDPEARGAELRNGGDYRHPYLHSGNAPPLYPPELVALRLEPQTVAVRLVIDEKGAVASIGPSPLRRSSEGPHAPAFEESVHAAVRTWKGEPARVYHFVPGPDGDGDGKADFERLDRQEVIKAYFDIVFKFEVKDGAPIVQTIQP